MNISSMHVYARMQEDIHHLQQCCETEILMIEGGFSIASRYWFDLESRLSTYSFRKRDDEIYFYKRIKPLFIAVMEYYSFRYKAILFRPAWGKAQLSLYWINELKRIDQFYFTHREFYQYLLEGRTDKDDIFFSRPAEPLHKPGERKGKEKPGNFYDDITARILGYQEYRKYIEAALRRLAHNCEQSMISIPTFCLNDLYIKPAETMAG